jgi:hypothetical protein
LPNWFLVKESSLPGDQATRANTHNFNTAMEKERKTKFIDYDNSYTILPNPIQSPFATFPYNPKPGTKFVLAYIYDEEKGWMQHSIQAITPDEPKGPKKRHTD